MIYMKVRAGGCLCVCLYVGLGVRAGHDSHVE